MFNKVAGVVLAGGRSSRMGENKALMLYQEQRLLDLTMSKLKALGLSDTFISGKIDGYGEYCIEDKIPCAGPACAIVNILSQLTEYDAALFLPVDVPLLTVELLEKMINSAEACFYQGHFLPSFIPLKSYGSLEGGCDLQKENLSVKKLLEALSAVELPIAEDEEVLFLNVNTPEKYQELIAGA